MAQFNLSLSEHSALAALLKTGDNASIVESDPDLQRIQKRLEQLQFNVRHCLVCSTEFEAENPRKKICSDRCRQELSRARRDPIKGQRLADKITKALAEEEKKGAMYWASPAFDIKLHLHKCDRTQKNAYRKSHNHSLE